MSTVMIAIGDRVIPAGRLAGIAEVTAYLNDSPTFRAVHPDGVTVKRVTSWAQTERRSTNGFPAPIVSHLQGIRLWDLDDFGSYEGPPGRWNRNAWADADD